MQPSTGKGLQLHDRMLRVPQGGGVRCGDYHTAVSAADRQTKTAVQSRRRVQQTVIIPLPSLIQQSAELTFADGAAPVAYRRGEQVKCGKTGLAHHRIFQRTSALSHIGKVHQGLVCEPQRKIEIPKPDVTVDTKHTLSRLGHGGPHSRHKGGLAGPALAGDHGDTFTHPDFTSFIS
ncbi:hypothetical protein SDC9_85422 [bioreactor metagenome]|uniref:Uncharacterized protein n=1 Tax=bioreactor metagenome TaxID=1076179 RepID=A0A644ZD20_9ZZZZ